MKRLKVLVIIVGLLVVCFNLYLFFSDSNQTKQISVETSIMQGQTGSDEKTDETIVDDENVSEDTAHKKEEQIEDVSIELAAEEEEVVEDDNNKLINISEGIKEKVREVVEGVKGVINIFKKDLKVVAIGDSLTQGVGDETESGGYVGILNHTFEDHDLKVTIENYGKRGNSSQQLLKRLEKEEIVASIQNADIVLITIGANDIMNIVKNNFTNLKIELFQQERLGYIERLTAIFNKINEINPDTSIYLIGFYNPFNHYLGDLEELHMIVNNWNKTGKTITEEFDNVNYIPISDLFSNSDNGLLADDYFHPNTSGYKLIAKRVLESLEEVSVEPEVVTENEE